MRGTTALRGQSASTVDGLVQLIISVIQRAQLDAAGDLKMCSAGERPYWQRDAEQFLEVIEDLFEI